MSVGLYDEAIIEKIKSWSTDPNLVILGVNESSDLFRWKSDTTDDKPIQLPLISLSRDSNMSVTLKSKRPLSYRGLTFVAANGKACHLNAVPIKLSYQIDIFTRYQSTADEYVREFVFQLINHPRCTIEIPYNNCDLKYDFFPKLSGEVEDNSDIPQRLIHGSFVRYTIKINVDDAYLFGFTRKNIPTINAEATSIASTKKLSDKHPDFGDDSQFETII